MKYKKNRGREKGKMGSLREERSKRFTKEVICGKIAVVGEKDTTIIIDFSRTFK